MNDQIIDLVQGVGDEEIVVMRDGIAVAVIIGYSRYQEMIEELGEE